MLASSRASPYAYNKCFLCRRMYVCMWEHADVMGQLPAPVSLGGETQALRNAYQLQEFRWKQIVTSPDAPFTRGERSTASTQPDFSPLRCVKIGPSPGGRQGAAACSRKALAGRLAFKASRIVLPLSTHQPVLKLCAQIPNLWMKAVCL